MEDSFTDEDADDSLGDLVRTFKTKLVIMSPTREDCMLHDVDKMEESSGASTADKNLGGEERDGVVADLSQKFDECNVEQTSPASLKELCRLANPFDTVGVIRARDKVEIDIVGETRHKGKRTLVTSAVPFETQVYVKGS